MKRLSSGITWYRFGMPALYVIGAAVLVNASPEIGPVIPFMLLGVVAYIIWFGWRLSEVWLDGDVLDEEGLRVFVLGLDHPVGRVQEIRFIPAGGAIEQDLQARIHAARGARKS